MKQREQLIQQRLELKAQSEVAGLTFKPAINRTPVTSTKPVAFVQREPKLLKEQGSSQLKGCTFSPVICVNSKKLAATNESKTVYERLYTTRPAEPSAAE